MAQVDFSSAVIEPYNTNPTYGASLSLSNSFLYDVSDPTQGVGSGTCTLLVNESKQLVYMFQGTFSQGGTAFRIKLRTGDTGYWKVSNISYSNGDTYLFTVNATLTCN